LFLDSYGAKKILFFEKTKIENKKLNN
jgi:hypothetical protein